MIQDMKRYGFNDSCSSLFPDLSIKTPDESFSTVPYEKGYQFVYFLESLVGE